MAARRASRSHPRRLRQRRAARLEVVLDGVDDHLAVVVRQDRVPLAAQPLLELVAVGHVAVVGAVQEHLAAHHVRLRVLVGDRAEGRPADLAAEQVPRLVHDAELMHHGRRRAHALAQAHVEVVALERAAGGVVAAVLEGAQQLGRDHPEVATLFLVHQTDDAAHDRRTISELATAGPRAAGAPRLSWPDGPGSLAGGDRPPQHRQRQPHRELPGALRLDGGERPRAALAAHGPPGVAQRRLSHERSGPLD